MAELAVLERLVWRQNRTRLSATWHTSSRPSSAMSAGAWSSDVDRAAAHSSSDPL
jgi:hypothetical protein